MRAGGGGGHKGNTLWFCSNARDSIIDVCIDTLYMMPAKCKFPDEISKTARLRDATQVSKFELEKRAIFVPSDHSLQMERTSRCVAATRM